MVIVIDFKGEGRFDRLPVAHPPAVRVSPADYAAHPDPNARVIVFRGDLFRGETASPEQIARFQWALAERRWPSLLVNDELTAATTHGQWKPRTKWLPQAFVTGRTKGVGQLWGSTSPLEIPAEPFEESHCILVFKLAGLGLRVLKRRNYLQGIDPSVIEGLAGMPLPPEQRGEFVLLRRGVRWDGKIYKFGEPAPADARANFRQRRAA